MEIKELLNKSFSLKLQTFLVLGIGVYLCGLFTGVLIMRAREADGDQKSLTTTIPETPADLGIGDAIEVKDLTDQIEKNPRVDQPAAENKEFESTSVKSGKVCVEVTGAVMVPGVYCFAQGALVVDAITKAGDFNRSAYAFRYVARYINLAVPISPGQKIYIPFLDDVDCKAREVGFLSEKPEPSNLTEPPQEDQSESENNENVEDPMDSSSGQGDSSSCININSATLAELDSLPGIGESTAQKIIDARSFEKLEDLLNVSGIGESKFNSIKDLVCL